MACRKVENMNNRRLVCLFVLILIFGFSGPPARAAAPGFSITASNTTLNPNGTGKAAYTLTSLNGFTGQVAVTCDILDLPAGAKVPFCGGGPLIAYTLTANETVSGSMEFYTNAIPVAVSQTRRPRLVPGAGLALAGALLFGFGLRRRARGWLMLTLLAVSAMAGFAGVSACNASENGLTPGTYLYAMYATDTSTSAQVSSTFNVTVP